MALLNMMYSSLFVNAIRNKMYFKVHVLYIDEGAAVYDWNEEQRQVNLQIIKSACDRYQFTYTIIPIEAIYDVNEALDLKLATKEEVEKIDEEKKRDENEHTKPNNI